MGKDKCIRTQCESFDHFADNNCGVEHNVDDCKSCLKSKTEPVAESPAVMLGSTDRILTYIDMRRKAEDYVGVGVLAGKEVQRLIEVAVNAEFDALERFIKTGQ